MPQIPKSEPQPDLQGIRLGVLKNNIERLVDELGPSLSISTIELFLAIACEEDLTTQELNVRLNRHQPTLSRQLMDLGPKRRRGLDGYGLIEGYDDPLDMRVKRWRLTDKGRALARKFI